MINEDMIIAMFLIGSELAASEDTNSSQKKNNRLDFLKCDECGDTLDAMKMCRCGWIHPMALEDHFDFCLNTYQMAPNDLKLNQETVLKTRNWFVSEK